MAGKVPGDHSVIKVRRVVHFKKGKVGKFKKVQAPFQASH